MGQLRKDNTSKEIIVKIDKQTNRATDELGRPVNANGYLINEQGSILNQKGEIVWMFYQLIQQEPMKIFKFTQWSLDWIKGDVPPDRLLCFTPTADCLYDDRGRLINNQGFLIDRGENIIDQYGRVVFKNDVLAVTQGQDAKIPKVFTMGILTDPYQLAESKHETLQQSSNQLNSNTTGLEMYLTEMGGKADKSKDKNGSIFNVGNDNFSESQNQTRQQNKKNDKSGTQRQHSLETDEKKKKKSNRLQRQHSHASEAVPSRRHGQKVLNLFQNYINDAHVLPPFSIQAETTTGQKIKPVLFQNQTPLSLQHRETSQVNSIQRIPLLTQNLDEPTRFASVNRQTRNSQQPFQSVANLSLGMQGRAPSVGGKRGVPHTRLNPYMRDDLSPIPMPRQAAYNYVPDNSYAARAEEIFINSRQMLSRIEDSDQLGFSGLHKNNRHDSRLAISQQIEDIQEIYSSKKKDRKGRGPL